MFWMLGVLGLTLWLCWEVGGRGVWVSEPCSVSVEGASKVDPEEKRRIEKESPKTPKEPLLRQQTKNRTRDRSTYHHHHHHKHTVLHTSHGSVLVPQRTNQSTKSWTSKSTTTSKRKRDTPCSARPPLQPNCIPSVAAEIVPWSTWLHARGRSAAPPGDRGERERTVTFLTVYAPSRAPLPLSLIQC
jgi:hypothetical protein